MSNSKRFKLTLPECLAKDFNKNNKKNCKYIRHKLIVYIEDKKKIIETEDWKNGYLEMAEINLDICEMGFAEEMSQLNQYEAELAESDRPNDYYNSKKRRYILC